MNDDDQEFRKRLDSRFRAHAWVIVLIATAVLLNQCSSELTTWAQNLLSGPGNTSY